MSNVFERLSLKENSIEMHQPITDENVKEFMSAIPDVDEDLTGRETISDLDKRPKLKAYLSHCTVERTYQEMWGPGMRNSQIAKITECCFRTITPASRPSP